MGVVSPCQSNEKSSGAESFLFEVIACCFCYLEEVNNLQKRRMHMLKMLRLLMPPRRQVCAGEMMSASSRVNVATDYFLVGKVAVRRSVRSACS